MKEQVRRCVVPLVLSALSSSCSPSRLASPAISAKPLESAEGGSAGHGPARIPLSYGYAFSFGAARLVVDPSDGGRVIEFSLAGKNVLRERSESESYGSSFWTSPQSDWGWPPPFELDAAPWAAKVEGKVLRLESAVVDELGVQVTQRILVDEAREAVNFHYTIANRGASPRKVAPWQNTRVRPSGLTLYPSGGALYEQSTLRFDTSGKVAYFKHDPSRFMDGAKSFGDGKEGWLAHVDGDLLFIKVFGDVPPEHQAPNEGEIEIFVDGAGKFVEIEQQGSYVELAPGESTDWRVTWYLRRLPEHVAAEPGSTELVDFIRATIGAG